MNKRGDNNTLQSERSFKFYNFLKMYTALEDIKLETIDFNWIKETTKISHLKRAIRLIEMDGNFFGELKDACYDRIGELDPSQK